MEVTVKVYTRLRKGLKAAEYARGVSLPLPPGSTVSHLIGTLGISAREFKLVFVNSRKAEPDHELHDGDTVVILPPVGGG